MKTFFLVISLGLLTACDFSNRSENQMRADAPSAKSQINIVDCPLPLYEIEKINLNGLKRLDSIAVTSMKISLQGKKIALPEYSRYENFYYIESTECDKIIVKSFIYKDESCCKQLYYVSTRKSDNSIIDGVRVALTGSDGEWQETDIMKKSTSGLSINAKSQEEIHNEMTGNYDSVSVTNVIYRVSMLKDGYFTRQKMDSSTVVMKK